LYRQLHKCGYKGTYCGIEVSEYIIKQDIHRHPEASWLCGTAYGIPFADRSFDLCFAFYVLEHLVYPKRALAEMMRVIKPGGHLALVFPDFVESGRLGSQQLGYSAADTALQKIRKGKIVDALVSLYDSRIRLPIALKTMKTTVGDFPVNSNPVCLSCPGAIGHDMDAVYIASKREVREWATVNNCSVKYPFGVKGKYILYAFMVIAK
jgi:SAM-dependent methyltransferase